jgi:hypothetical protein
MLNALRSGQVFVSRDVDGPQLYLSREPGGVRVHVVGAGGATLTLLSDAGPERSVPVAGDDWTDVLRRGDECAYVRAELTSAGGEMLALSNAV